MLPQQVPFDDAKFNLSRAGILAAVLSGQNHVIGAGRNIHELLMAATEDRLHQDYRRQSMQPSHALVTWLRGAGKAAVISGAGPTVLSLESIDPKVQADAQAAGWAVRPLKLATSGLQITRGNLSTINGGCVFVWFSAQSKTACVKVVRKRVLLATIALKEILRSPNVEILPCSCWDMSFLFISC